VTARHAAEEWSPRSARTCSMAEYREKTDLNRKILDQFAARHLRRQRGPANREADLILVPTPSRKTIQAVLGRYPFKDPGRIRQPPAPGSGIGAVLSTRRAAATFGQHPRRSCFARWPRDAPIRTWPWSSRKSDRVAGRQIGPVGSCSGFNPPSLKLYVDLCAWEPVPLPDPHQQSGMMMSCSTT